MCGLKFLRELWSVRVVEREMSSVSYSLIELRCARSACAIINDLDNRDHRTQSAEAHRPFNHATVIISWLALNHCHSARLTSAHQMASSPCTLSLSLSSASPARAPDNATSATEAESLACVVSKDHYEEECETAPCHWRIFRDMCSQLIRQKSQK